MASTHVIVLSLLFQAFLSSAMQIAPPDEETKLLDFAPEETPAFHEFPILRDRVEKFDQKKIDRLIEWSKEYGATFNAHYYIEVCLFELISGRLVIVVHGSHRTGYGPGRLLGGASNEGPSTRKPFSGYSS